MENCALSPLKIYLEYLDVDKVRRSVENLSEIFGDKMRGKVEESLMAAFNEP